MVNLQLPAMRELSNLRAGCEKWLPLDTPGTQNPSSDAVVKVTKRRLVGIRILQH